MRALTHYLPFPLSFSQKCAGESSKGYPESNIATDRMQKQVQDSSIFHQVRHEEDLEEHNNLLGEKYSYLNKMCSLHKPVTHTHCYSKKSLLVSILLISQQKFLIREISISRMPINKISLGSLLSFSNVRGPETKEFENPVLEIQHNDPRELSR